MESGLIWPLFLFNQHIAWFSYSKMLYIKVVIGALRGKKWYD